MAFGKAFAAAKKAGKRVFTYNGKKYNTKTKDEVGAEIRKAASKAKPTPSPRKAAEKKGATEAAPKSAASKPAAKKTAATGSDKSSTDGPKKRFANSSKQSKNRKAMLRSTKSAYGGK